MIRDRILDPALAAFSSSRLGAALIALSIASVASAQSVVGVMSTAAGTGTAGGAGDGGPATAAQVSNPTGVAVDSAGSVYIADYHNHRVRRIAAGSGVMSTFAGTGVEGFLGDGGAATAARLRYPSGLAVDAAGNLYITDEGNYRIRKVTIATGIISTVAGDGVLGSSGDGGPAVAARFNRPTAVAVAASGNLYVADAFNHRVRKITAATGLITTVAGTGTPGYNGEGAATGARLYEPWGVAVDGEENLYIADYRNHRIRKVTAATSAISTIAGTGVNSFSGENGAGASAGLSFPMGVAADAAGTVYIADTNNQRIRKLAAGIINTVAGSGGTAGYGGDGGEGPGALLNVPNAVAVSAGGALYIADTSNHRVRVVSPPTVATRVIRTIAGTGTAGYNGDGPATGAQLQYPFGVAVDPAGNVYIADSSNQRIRKIAAGTGALSTVAGTGIAGFTGDGLATAVRLAAPAGVATDGGGNLFIADESNHRVRKLTVATGVLTTIAGTGAAGAAGDNGPATAAQLNRPRAVALDAAGNVFIADFSNHKIRKIDIATGLMTTVAGIGTPGAAGDGGPATAAQLSGPAGVAVDGSGNVYIADSANNRVRKIAAGTAAISTVAGSIAGFRGESEPAATAWLWNPLGVTVDAAGDVYVVDHFNFRIRKITVATGRIATVAGSGTDSLGGGDGSVATAAQLHRPTSVAVDAGGTLYIADQYDHRVRLAALPMSAPALTLTRVPGAAAATLSWTPASGASGYIVRRGTTQGGAKSEVASVSGTSFVDTGVSYNTRYYYVVSAVRVGESADSNEGAISVSRAAVPSDFDGDGRTDVGVFRSSNGNWYVRYASTGSGLNFLWGGAGDVPTVGDYDGDGFADIAIFRPSNGTWYVRYTATGALLSFLWGGAGDVPAQGDYDGDGKTDMAIFRPSTGTWYIRYTVSGAELSLVWGGAGDMPVAGDYDGDGWTDIAIFRPSTGTWYVRYTATGTGIAPVWGGAGDVPVQADYDGDGTTDIAIFRVSSGTWFVRDTATGTGVSLVWGGGTDVPAPGDYDGDGLADIAIFRPSTGTWFIRYSATGAGTSFVWGGQGDVPVIGRQ